MDTIWFIFMHVVLEGPYYNSHGRRQKIFNRNTYVNYSPLFTLPLITARIQVMEFKFLLIALMVGIVLAQYEASSKTCPRWLKLNKSPVCFGARGDQFGRFSYHRNIFVSSFMIVHRSGKVSSDSRNYNYWGGTSDGRDLGVLLTDQSNKLLAPQSSIVSKGGWYKLAGYSGSSPVLLFCVSKKPQCVFANSELRLWYGEDLRGPASESNNRGKSCADVYGLLA